jgi:hypothetical protein
MTASRTKRRARQDWGELSAEMRALPNDAWRAFCYALVTDQGKVHGLYARAARTAGFGKKSTPTNLAKHAHEIAHDERMIAAVAVEGRRRLRMGHPIAVNNLLNIAGNSKHKDQMRAISEILARSDPVISKQDISVTHRVIDPDQEALEELRALRHLGTSREKLLTLFGHNGLDRIEALEAADTSRRADSAKVVDGKHTRAECHCGKDGHALNSVNCPVHGYAIVEMEAAE